MKDAFTALIKQLPECECDPDLLCKGARYFSLTAEEVQRAAELLPEHQDLRYQGVRRILSLCISEFADIFSEQNRRRCEVTVPAPPFAMFALQRAVPKIRFVSEAFFAQIMLRGILLSRRPIDDSSCAMRHCGLNRMRLELMKKPPVDLPAYQLQFGLLCIECVKTGESAPESVHTITLPFPEKRGVGKAAAKQFYEELFRRMGAQPDCAVMREAFGLYGRLVRAENRITALCSRQNRETLWGNSLSLAQSVQLLTADRAEEFIKALELLAEELETAPEVQNERRFYCYYIPFLQPGIDRRFRENGITLTGNAAFLLTGRAVGLDLAGMTEAWAENMAIRESPEKQCAAIAEAMAASGSEAYLTGFFSFDRRLGASVPLQRKILKEQYGIQTKLLDTDFWCENAMFGNPENRIDLLCV